MFRAALIVLCLGVATGCATAPPALRAPFAVEGVDPVVTADVATARARIEAFFGAPFAAAPRIVVADNRAAFDAALPPAWDMTPTQCWMVGVGVADLLVVLAPPAWGRDACEHSGSDAGEVQGIVTHELTHVYHGQHNPTRDFTGMDEAGWFVEGLATHVAGQSRVGAGAADAIAAGAAPTKLADAWSGSYRYGVSGSMVAFIDATWGRATLVGLLGATSNAQILEKLGVSEGEFLTRWRAWVTR